MIMLRRVVSTPGLHWLPAYLELSLYIIIEPAQEELCNKRHCKPAAEPGFSERSFSADEPGLSGRSSTRGGHDGFYMSIGFSAPSFT